MVLAGLNHFRVAGGPTEAIVPAATCRRTARSSRCRAPPRSSAASPLILPATRPLARPWLVGLLVAVSPVHVWMLQRPDLYPRTPRPALSARLALQPALIGLVVLATGRP